MRPKNRIAQCGCKNTKIELSGNPEIVAICNCLECQRRTGSVFGVSAYFNKESVVSQSGDMSHYIRVSEGGKEIDLTFCKNCGTTVWWHADFLPEYLGTAVGCFGDPEFPQPLLSVWEASKHPWVRFSWLALPFSKQTPDSLNQVLLVLRLPKFAHLMLSVVSLFKKRKIMQSTENCALTQIEAIICKPIINTKLYGHR